MNLVTAHFSDYLSAGDLSVYYPLPHQYYKWVCHKTGWHNIQAPTHLHYNILQNTLRFFLISEAHLEYTVKDNCHLVMLQYVIWIFTCFPQLPSCAIATAKCDSVTHKHSVLYVRYLFDSTYRLYRRLFRKD
jgi:hypothetical protein